jgi:WD40 repeat protein/serine/threonine protein kinase
MTASRPNNEAIFHAARAIPDLDHRREYVRETCSGDEARIAHVEALLAAADAPDQLLDRPAVRRSVEGILELYPQLGTSLESLAADLDSAARPPASAGRFQLGEELARGGMGIVYRARDDSLGRDVAVKVLQEQFLVDSLVGQRFLDEAQITAQLQHPAIPPVFEVGRLSDERPYLAMKLIKGRTLEDLLKERPEPASDRGRFLAVFQQICQAVGFAHSKHILHRDLKPANVMVGAFGEVQVMDWGLAKLLGADGQAALEPAAGTETTYGTVIHSAREPDSATLAGSMLGTPAFMAPEQAGGELDRIDERTDVFGLGAILCVILTGEPPYTQKSGDDVRLMAVRGKLADAYARLDECGADAKLVELCRECLSAERDERPRDAAAVAATITSYLASVEERARQAELERAASEVRAAEQRKRRRVQLVLAAALVLVPVAFAWTQNRHAGHLAEEHGKTLTALAEAQRQAAASMRQAAASILDRALASCEHGESGRGLLWLARGLELAHKAGDADLESAFRWELGAWGAETHELILALDYPGLVFSVALSADGRLMAAAGPDGRVFLWRTDTGAAYRPPLAHPAGVRGLAFLPSTHTLLTGCADGAARLWDCDRGALLGDPMSHYRSADRPAREWPFLDGISSVAVSPDGKRAVTGGCDGTIRLWSLPDGRSLASAVASVEPVLAVAFAPDGRTVVSGSCDWEVSRWDGTSLQRLGPPHNLGGVVWGLAFTPDGRTALAGVQQGNALLRLDLEAGTKAPPLKHLGSVAAAASTPDGRLLVSGGWDQVARLWDAVTGRPFGPPLPAAGGVTSVAVGSDGRFVAVGSDEGAVRLWRLAPGAQRRAWRHPPRANSVAFTPDGRYLLAGNSGGQGGETVRWEVSTGLRAEPTLRHTNGLGWVNGLAVSPDGAFVYTADSQNQVVHRWEAATGKELGVTGRHGDEVWRLALSPDGRRLLTGTPNYQKPPLGCSVRLWDAATGSPVGAPMKHASAVVGIAFSPDGKTVLTGSQDRTTRLWDAATGNPLGPPQMHAAAVIAVSFHPDGKTVLTGGTDRNAQRWDLATWSRLGPPLVHDAEVTGVGFTPDGRLIVTTSHDRTARLWHPETGKQVGPPLMHAGAVSQAVCAPDGASLATCDWDGSVRLWALSGCVLDEPAEVTRRATLLTGLSLDEAGTVRVLDPPTWRTARAERGDGRLTTGRGPAPADSPPRSTTPQTPQAPP